MNHIEEARKRLQSSHDCHARVHSYWDDGVDSCDNECTKLKLALLLANCILDAQSQRQIRCTVDAKGCKLIPIGCLSPRKMAVEEYGDGDDDYEPATQQGSVMNSAYTHVDTTCLHHKQLQLLDSSLDVQRITYDAAVASLEKLESTADQIDLNAMQLERNLEATEQAVLLGQSHVKTLESTDRHLRHALSEMALNLELTRGVSEVAAESCYGRPTGSKTPQMRCSLKISRLPIRMRQ